MDSEPCKAELLEAPEIATLDFRGHGWMAILRQACLGDVFHVVDDNGVYIGLLVVIETDYSRCRLATMDTVYADEVEYLPQSFKDSWSSVVRAPRAAPAFRVFAAFSDETGVYKATIRFPDTVKCVRFLR